MEEIKTQFINYFNPEILGFNKPTPFTDAIGFSITKKCDSKYLKVKSNKNYISMIKLYIDEPNYKNTNKIPIHISVSLDLFEDEMYKINDSFIKNKLSKPLSLSSHNDFFYNLNEHKFYKKNIEVAPNDIINEIYMLHIKPTKPIKGFILRTRLFKNFVLNKILRTICNLLNCFLWIISGKSYSFNIYTRIFREFKDKEEDEHDEKSKSGKTIKIFEYQASMHSISTYCLIHLIFFTILLSFNIKPEVIKIILKYNLLTLMYGICSLVVYEYWIPSILKAIIKKISRFSFHFENKSIKI